METVSSQLPLLELARGGNLQAIAYWIDRYLIPEGIYTRVEALRTGCLNVAIEFRQVPVGLSPQSVLSDRGRGESLQNRLVRFICHQLWRLDCEAIEGVRIAARFAGQSQILWQRSVRLLSPAAKRRLEEVEENLPKIADPQIEGAETTREENHDLFWYSLLLAGAAMPSFAIGFGWGYRQLQADPISIRSIDVRFPQGREEWNPPPIHRQPQRLGFFNEVGDIHPHVQTVGGRPVAYLEYRVRGNGEGIDRDDFVAALREIRDRVDWVIVSWRWQGGLDNYPTAAQIELSHLAIDEGADLVLGLHPDTLQGGEIYRDRPIIYASSDVLFADSHAADGETAVVKVAVKGDRFRVEWIPTMVREGRSRKLGGEGRWRVVDRVVTRSLFASPLPLEAVFEMGEGNPFVRRSFVTIPKPAEGSAIASGEPQTKARSVLPFATFEAIASKNARK